MTPRTKRRPPPVRSVRTVAEYYGTAGWKGLRTTEDPSFGEAGFLRVCENIFSDEKTLQKRLGWRPWIGLFGYPFRTSFTDKVEFLFPFTSKTGAKYFLIGGGGNIRDDGVPNDSLTGFSVPIADDPPPGLPDGTPPPPNIEVKSPSAAARIVSLIETSEPPGLTPDTIQADNYQFGDKEFGDPAGTDTFQEYRVFTVYDLTTAAAKTRGPMKIRFTLDSVGADITSGHGVELYGPISAASVALAHWNAGSLLGFVAFDQGTASGTKYDIVVPAQALNPSGNTIFGLRVTPHGPFPAGVDKDYTVTIKGRTEVLVDDRPRACAVIRD